MTPAVRRSRGAAERSGAQPRTEYEHIDPTIVCTCMIIAQRRRTRPHDHGPNHHTTVQTTTPPYTDAAAPIPNTYLPGRHSHQPAVPSTADRPTWPPWPLRSGRPTRRRAHARTDECRPGPRRMADIPDGFGIHESRDSGKLAPAQGQRVVSIVLANVPNPERARHSAGRAVRFVPRRGRRLLLLLLVLVVVVFYNDCKAGCVSLRTPLSSRQYHASQHDPRRAQCASYPVQAR